jgi:hypothetical protein
MNLHTPMFLGMSKKWILKKSCNAVFPFNVEKGTRGYVFDCSRRYISRDRNYDTIIHLPL